MFYRLTCFLLFIFLSSHLSFASNLPSISAEAAILIEAHTGTVLYEKNAYQKLYPASTTKILTSLILLEELDLSTSITKTQDSVRTVPSDSSHIGLRIGDTFSAKDGLYGILLGSDNFIAHDMAVKCAGSIENFSRLMNQKAISLGATSSNFVNPHGYHDPNHYTTAYDLAQIARGAFSNPTLSKIAGTSTSSFHISNRNKTLSLTNTSRLLKSSTPYYNPNVVACKTGYHTPAGQTLVAKASYDNIDLIAVALKTTTPRQYEDINKLFEYGTKNFSTLQLSDGSYIVQKSTYTNWFAPYITYALEKSWIDIPPLSYKQPISNKDFIVLLKNVLASYPAFYTNSYTFDQFLNDYTLTRLQASRILHTLNNSLHFTTYSPISSSVINDISSLSLSDQTTIQFMVNNRLLAVDSNAFYPEDSLSYEQALCLLYRLENYFLI